MLDYTFKRFPNVLNLVNFIESSRSYPKVNINNATAEELVAIPYIGQYTAQQILAYRESLGRFASLEELKLIKGIKEKNYQIFVNYLTVGGVL